MSIEVMKQALEALDNLARYADICELFLKETHPGKAYALRERVTISIKIITSLRQAIEQAEKQEPVAWRWMPAPYWKQWVYSDDGERIAEAKRFMGDGGVQPLYTTPPAQEFVCSTGLCHYKAQRTFVGLTDEEVKDFVWNLPYEPSQEHIRAIEAKLKEKNT